MASGSRGPLARPRYRAYLDRWEVKVGGKYVAILDERGDPVKGNTRESEARANACWHLAIDKGNASDKGLGNLLSVVFDLYMEDANRLRPHRTPAATRALQSFLDAHPGLTVGELTEAHLDAWFEANPDWVSPGTRRTKLGFLVAALNWASQVRGGKRLIPFEHPLRGMDFSRLKQKTYFKKRGSQATIDEAVHVFLMHNVKEDFRQILLALRHTGTRPGNICKVKSHNFIEDPGVWVFDEGNVDEGTVHKTYEKTREALVVPLTETLTRLCKVLAEKYPTGPLFRRSDGGGWTSFTLANTFTGYCKRFRKRGFPIPKMCFAYCYRHDTATRLIEGGETDAMAAAALGHKGTGTLHAYYNHVAAKARVLVETMRRQVRDLPGESLERK